MIPVSKAIPGVGARWSFLWLAMGLVLTLFGTGKWVVPFAAWFGWVFLLRWMRTRATENKVLLIDPPGTIVLQDVKYGGTMLEGTLRGSGVLQTVSTPYGVLSAAICWDADFVATVGQAGRNGTDILVIPAHDWAAITPMHGHMAVFRAVESRVSVFRQADQGTSIATDPYGRILAEQNHFLTSEHVLVAQVPVKGLATLESVVRGGVGWVSVAGFLVLAGWVVLAGSGRGRRSEGAAQVR